MISLMNDPPKPNQMNLTEHLKRVLRRQFPGRSISLCPLLRSPKDSQGETDRDTMGEM